MILPDLHQLATDIAELDLLPGNPRKGDIDAVARSLEQFGQRKPIVARRADRTVIAGNHTLQAARKLGWTEIAVVWVDDDDASAKAFALADNRTADLGTYDDEALLALIEEVHQADAALLETTGWTEADMHELIDSIHPDTIDVPDDADDVPSNPPAITVPGDIWLLGPHRLLCGDATSTSDLDKLMSGNTADCIFTDPPYNVAYDGGTDKKMTIANDDMTDDAFHRFLLDSFTAMQTVLKAGGAIYVCHADRSTNAFRNAFHESGFLLKQVLIWVKDRFVLSRQDYNWQHEPILYGWKPGAAHNWYGPFNQSTVIDNETDITDLKKDELIKLIEDMRSTTTVVRHKRPGRSDEHPTMKPVELIVQLTINNTRAGNIILDPFGGSGSTLIAAHQSRRICHTVELDEHYCDVICARFQKLTGIKPIAAATGNEHDFLKDN